MYQSITKISLLTGCVSEKTLIIHLGASTQFEARVNFNTKESEEPNPDTNQMLEVARIPNGRHELQSHHI